ncbi:MAG TPA: FecR domain-containing protein, partial [Polyangiaceae bacterium]
MARHSVNPLDHLGRRVAEGLDAYAGERSRALDTARERFLETAVRVPSRRSRTARVAALLAAAAVLVLVAGVFIERARRPLTFVANGEPASLETWLAATGRPLPVDFSDGTRLRLEPASRMRVIDVAPNGASVALENGTLHADVVHRSASAWRVIAGPLTVRVTGTRFDLGWSAATEEFSVAVREGSVAVSGAVVGGERAVRAGETLKVRVGEKRLELTNSAELAKAEPSDARLSAKPRAPELGAPSPPGSAPVAPAAASSPQLAPREDWRELARRGLLRKAFTAAEASGFDAACATSSAAELLQLGDAARLSGRPERARQALLSLRSRHPTDPRRAAAAFALGKVAFDQSGAFAQAAEWFATSLREQPNGSLSREAAGRLIE